MRQDVLWGAAEHCCWCSGCWQLGPAAALQVVHQAIGGTSNVQLAVLHVMLVLSLHGDS
jgi:hypothetical protein